MWLTVLLAAIGWVLSWLLSKQRSGKPLTEAERRKVNKAIFEFDKLRRSAVSLGCNPNGEDDP